MNLRGATRRWLKNWERVGPMLEAERLAGLQALTDAEAARIACDLWRLARPGGGDRLVARARLRDGHLRAATFLKPQSLSRRRFFR
jgi:hypothetical protein